MGKLSSKAINIRLEKAFMSNYKEHEWNAEWYNNTSENSWRFDIPELKKQITLICNEYTGSVEIKESEMI